MDARRGPPHAAFHLPTLYFGGAERATVNLAGYLVRQGWTVSFVLHTAGGELLRELAPGMRVHDLKVSWMVRALAVEVPRTMRAVGPLMGFLKRERPDVLIPSETNSSVAALVARRLAGSRVPIVVAEHSVVSTAARNWRCAARLRLIRATYPMAERLVTVSRGAAEELRHAARLDAPPLVIHNPVLTARAPAAPADDPWFAPGAPPVFVAAGRMSPVKGFDILLEAFALLRATLEARLLLLGKGPLEGELAARAQALGIAGAVRFAGFVTDPGPYFRGAAAVVVPSRQESFGNVLVEAMSSGCPVVSTDCDGPRDILDGGRYGRLVPVGNAAALAAAMAETVRRAPDPAPLIRRASDFTVERSGARWLAVLDSVVAAARGDPIPSRGAA